MSFINPPPRPDGTDEEALWVQWVHDEIATYGNLVSTPFIKWSKTTSGIVPVFNPQFGGARIRPHPFQVTQSPSHASATEDWRTFRVRAGAYGTTPVAGTDGADVAAGGNITEGVNDIDDPTTETLDTAYSTSIDIIVPDATESYYIWVDATDPLLPEIDHGATIPGGGTDDDWWNNTGYILIAIIDTQTFTATKIAKRRQFVRDDIPKCL
jgi:hypothetical protein